MIQSKEEHPLMTVSEAADSLRLSRHTINNWLSQGRLHRVKLGGRTFLERDEVVKMLQDARSNSGEDQ